MDKEERVKMGLESRLKQAEGFVSIPYNDRGSFTFGYGHNVSAMPVNKELRAKVGIEEPTGVASIYSSITQEAATKLLKHDIEYFYKRSRNLVPHFQELSANRQEAVVEMMFNLGETRFRDFEKFIEALRKRDYNNASSEMLDSKWHKEGQVGDRSRFLAEKLKKG